MVFTCVCALLLPSPVVADAQQNGGENPSNPLSKGKNTDLRWQYLDEEVGHIHDLSFEGAFMVHDKLKLKHELHYWETGVTGSSEKIWNPAC